MENDINTYDPTFANIDAFESAQNWVEFDCTNCNDTGFDYDLNSGDKILCTCAKGMELGEELAHEEEDYDDSHADGEALASAGWGTDEDYGMAYDYDDWN